MMIQNINLYQGQQNAVRSDSVNNSATMNSEALSGGPVTKSGPSQGEIAMINNLPQQVNSDLNVVRDPPFFPIATYQRADLIKRVRIVEEEVQRSSLDASVKSAISTRPLKTEATDKGMDSARNRLSTLRDQFSSSKPASPDPIEPGSILAVEI
jgi:hypothetical protein